MLFYDSYGALQLLCCIGALNWVVPLLLVPLAFMYLPANGLIDLIQHGLFFLPAFLFPIRNSNDARGQYK